MVNPTLTYDNEYNRRLREILTNYDDIEASRNSPTMITGGMRLKSHIDDGNTPYDGREGTAPFSNTVTGGVRRPRMIEDILDTPPITDMRYRGRVPKMPSNAEIMSAYSNAMKGGEMIGGNDAKFWGKFALDTGIKAYRLKNQFDNLMGRGAVGGNRRANTKEDAVFWRDFADNTANSIVSLGDKTKKLFGGNRRANTKEDAVFWRDFADNTANSMVSLGDKTKKLFGGRGKRANRKEDAVFWRDFADNTANSMVSLGDKTKKLFGGKKGGFLPKRKSMEERVYGNMSPQQKILMKAMDSDFGNSMAQTHVRHANNLGGASISDIGRYMPKVMAYNAINNATGRHLPGLFGGAEGCGLPKKIGKKVGKVVSARGAIVSRVMKEHGLSLPMASKYVKENGLY